MSNWVYINGAVDISCRMGNTQPQIEYIIKTVLEHLPNVYGSEGGMEVVPIKKEGYNCSCSVDEFGMSTNNLIDPYGEKSNRGWLRTQENYVILVYGDLRDAYFETTYKEFQNWICRLSKRLKVNNVTVSIRDYDREEIITNKNRCYTNMYQDPAYFDPDSEPNWCEFMLWDRAKDSQLPMLLQYKYCNDPENDKEVERRKEYYKNS